MGSYAILGIFGGVHDDIIDSGAIKISQILVMKQFVLSSVESYFQKWKLWRMFGHKSIFMDQNIREFQVFVKPVGPVCNMGCTYCYYLEKEELFAENGVGTHH